MEAQEREEIQQCVTELDFLGCPDDDIDLKIDISRRINQQLPANELRDFQRPAILLPRTFFLERPLHQLPHPLDHPCIEAISNKSINCKEGSAYHFAIANPENLPLCKYFSSEQWRCVYNKLSGYRSDSQQFSGRFKSLDLLLDYNWKSFKQLQPEISLPGEYREHDSIDSDFESGNLCRAYTALPCPHSPISPPSATVTPLLKQYHMLLQNDLNTYGYNTWFFFRVRNAGKGLRKFTLLNIIKKNAFYSQGMRISIFSMQKWREDRSCWFKGGQQVAFGPSPFYRDHHHEHQLYSALQFQYEFQYQFDQVYFAASQPYTYSRLANLIQEARATAKNTECQVKTIGYSIANNILPVLKFSKSNGSSQAIVLIGRQHPCETVGSFIVEGLIRQLSDPKELTCQLLKQFQFHVIPMVNPDGVIHGCSRTNMAGLDLNRQWSQSILKDLAPESVKIKHYLLNLCKTRTIKYVIDFHGHGKKLNSFLFCCRSDQPRETQRLLPFVMAKRDQRFCLSSCTYGISKDKETTLRALTNSLGIAHSYTLQTSLYGWKHDTDITHFNENDYRSIANSLLQSISILQGQNEDTERIFGTTKAKLQLQLTSIMDALEREQRLNDARDNLSDSDPQGDRLDVKDLLKKCENKLIKKKIQESLNLNQKLKIKGSLKSNGRQTIRVLSFKNVQPYPRKQVIPKTGFKNPLISSKDSGYLEFSEFQTQIDSTPFSAKKKQHLIQRMRDKKTVIANIKSQYQQKGQSLEVFNLNRPKLRARIRTENASKNKEEARQRTEYNEIVSSKTSQTQQKKPHPLSYPPQQKKLRKRQNSSVLQNGGLLSTDKNILTDTISVIKVGITAGERLNEFQRPVKNICLRLTRTEETKELTFSNESMAGLSKSGRSGERCNFAKLKTFKQFLVKQGNLFPRRGAKQGSNYYHFPVL